MVNRPKMLSINSSGTCSTVTSTTAFTAGHGCADLSANLRLCCVWIHLHVCSWMLFYRLCNKYTKRFSVVISFNASIQYNEITDLPQTLNCLKQTLVRNTSHIRFPLATNVGGKLHVLSDCATVWHETILQQQLHKGMMSYFGWFGLDFYYLRYFEIENACGYMYKSVM